MARTQGGVFMDYASATRKSVLIVDQSLDSREVLRAVFELRGWNILEADGASEGLEMAEQFHPDVILLDTDTHQADDAAMQASYEDASRRNQASLVVIGQARCAAHAGRQRVVAKPYHYAPLIRTIDELAASVLAKAS
jgi:CheY-like chemotaxis protein